MNQVGSAGGASIALCYGTRPQVIKASVLRSALAQRFPVLAVDTGQHYDHVLNGLLYDQLGVQPPELFLEVGSGTHGEQTAAIVTRCEGVLRDRRPGIVVVIGDTNSTLGCGLAAAKLRIPVVHVEAGLRARDALMAEEINRRVIDALASVLCAPSRAAADRLRRERPEAVIVETGDVARDVLMRQDGHLPPLGGLLPNGLKSPFIFCTLHRAELTDDPARLGEVLTAIGHLPVPVVLPMHPRTRSALGGSVDRGFGPALHLTPPVGYLESIALTRAAAAVLTDSGGVQREAYWLGVPCVTIRGETEWEETLEEGANRLLQPRDVASGLRSMINQILDGAGTKHTWNRDAYGTGDAAERIADAIEDTVGPRT